MNAFKMKDKCFAFAMQMNTNTHEREKTKPFYNGRGGFGGIGCGHEREKKKKRKTTNDIVPLDSPMLNAFKLTNFIFDEYNLKNINGKLCYGNKPINRIKLALPQIINLCLHNPQISTAQTHTH